ncbi:M61 family metallopeptidase [Flagellimonas hadalis]|uniref:M61 family metallopeptidase n=1 Tax=Flagellimonas hadalis TaxID=2597517 RepID=A0A5N5IQ05_9FLAO|nr:M61 family metallopeptidase [Allomuricauda hadalis]KAB5489495.1 M61 family metallopeptidase [Allomuricauda hadalis]
MKNLNLKKFLVLLPFLVSLSLSAQKNEVPRFEFAVSVPDPGSHTYHVATRILNWPTDTITLHLPNWMPGYYQMMDYYKGLKNFKVLSGQSFDESRPATWVLTGVKGKAVQLEYDMYTDRTFVANSYVDEDRAYIIPVNSFLYAEGHLKMPITVTVEKSNGWTDVVTGLELVEENAQKAVFRSNHFDDFLDSPLLMGNLKKLPDFQVGGTNHRFWGYNAGEFDEKKLMDDLKSVIEVASGIIGHIPYEEYTFIGIGPGRGGIEHLNSSTVSFDGGQMGSPQAYQRMVNFLSHEYFHHYNVKRIRPFELGPFDYQNGSKTTQLWISEGLTSYYAGIMVRRAGIYSEADFLQEIAAGITQFENNPGKDFQSLIESSFETWHEGPFGTSGKDPNKSISYYVKGPIVGLLMDFGIRQATNNEKSLDDVMRHMYHEYYLKKGRGFTDAEFRNACTFIAGTPLTELFQYVYTPNPLDYDTYLGYAGLELEKKQETRTIRGRDGESTEKVMDVYSLVPVNNPNASQKAILDSWMGKNKVQ